MTTPSSIHLIGNAHLDPQWLWPWQEGMSEARATFSSALERGDEFPEFIFTASAAALYQWIEKTDPALFRRIQARVREGRWCIPGGWHTQSDCNLPSGESFARNALYSQRYFQDRFGLASRTGYCVDSFGHAGSLPQLLDQGGMRAFVFQRPAHYENATIPLGPFIWEGTDGTRLLCYRLRAGYNVVNPDKLAEQARELRAQSLPLGMIFYGVGDHGGGPTKTLLSALEALRREQPDMRYSDPERFFDELAPHAGELPVWKGEIQPHAVGCYSAHSATKRLNRRAVWALLTAERLAFSAALHGAALADGRASSWARRIEQYWCDVLFADFHDVSGGACERSATSLTVQQLGRAEFSAGEIAAEAAQSIGAGIDTRGPGRALLVFNPHAFPLRKLVETGDINFHPYFDDARVVQVLDAAGNPIAFQSVEPSSRACVVRVVFPADLPPLGWRLFRIAIGPRNPSEPLVWEAAVPPSTLPLPGSLSATPGALENEHLRLTVDDRGFVQLLDRGIGWNAFSGPAGVPLVLEDPSDTWSHGVVSYDREAGPFELRSRELAETGPLRACLRLRYTFGASDLALEYRLGRHDRTVHCKATLDWREKRRMLKFVYPVNVSDPRWTSEIPYGVIERPLDGREYPMQCWTDLSDDAHGLSVANDSKYGVDARQGALRITALRSPLFGHHDPIAVRGGEWHQDQGLQEFSFVLVPHGPDWRAPTACAAHELNGPPVLSWEGTHDGPLPTASGPLCVVDRDDVIVTVLKPAEEGDAWIVRAIDVGCRGGTVTLGLPPLARSWQAAFRPGQVRTFRVPRDHGAAVGETDFLERA